MRPQGGEIQILVQRQSVLSRSLSSIGGKNGGLEAKAKALKNAKLTISEIKFFSFKFFYLYKKFTLFSLYSSKILVPSDHATKSSSLRHNTFNSLRGFFIFFHDLHILIPRFFCGCESFFGASRATIYTSSSQSIL